MLNCVLPALFVLLAACSVPARDRTPPRDEALPAPPAETVPPHAIVVAEPAAPAHAEASSPTRALFFANCAQCHGEKGDGLGVTQLDRKARSFLDGGFSYGNTKDAILRSITHGIPGTPMPAFEKALNESQRVELAQYVIAFGPDQIVVDPSESEIIVKDRPVIVRGRLPAIVEGATEWPRGIAIGTPDGLTFEYRADDVQLVGVRAGRFLNRTDWGERGGTGLEMLGKPVWIADAVQNPLIASLKRWTKNGAMEGSSSSARLIATGVGNGEAWIEYAVSTLAGGDGGRALVRETASAYRSTLGSGFCVRRIVRANSDGLCVPLMDFRIPMPFLTAGKARVSWRMEPDQKRTLLVMIARGGIDLDRDGLAAVVLPPDTDVSIEAYLLTDIDSQLHDDSKLLDAFVRREFKL